MARPLRIEFPGAIYHVTARGNARQAIVCDDKDRAVFLVCLGEVVLRFVRNNGVGSHSLGACMYEGGSSAVLT